MSVIMGYTFDREEVLPKEAGGRAHSRRWGFGYDVGGELHKEVYRKTTRVCGDRL